MYALRVTSKTTGASRLVRKGRFINGTPRTWKTAAGALRHAERGNWTRDYHCAAVQQGTLGALTTDELEARFAAIDAAK